LLKGEMVDGAHRIAAWIAEGRDPEQHPVIELPPNTDPWVYVYTQHAGTRNPTLSELVAQVRAHLAAIPDLDEETAIRYAACGNERYLKMLRLQWRKEKNPPAPKTYVKRAAGGEQARVIIPDSHGEHIDPEARDAFLADLVCLNPFEIVLLGDHLDCGGVLSVHQRSYTNELTESYDADVAAANAFLDAIQKAAPKARIHYLEGNHEQHVERWATREFENHKDAVKVLDVFGPEAQLKLKKRGIAYYKRSEMYMGLSLPGTIKLGNCYFTHGTRAPKHSADRYVQDFSGNVVFGHVHRAQSVITRSVNSSSFGAWCPGTLAKLQMLYGHTALSGWSHGYGLQYVLRAGDFMHINVPIVNGRSLLPSKMRGR
jgi:hypothetical protein